MRRRKLSEKVSGQNETDEVERNSKENTSRYKVRKQVQVIRGWKQFKLFRQAQNIAYRSFVPNTTIEKKGRGQGFDAAFRRTWLGTSSVGAVRIAGNRFLLCV